MRKLCLCALVILLISNSCEERDCCAEGTELSGTWLLFETGHSPGWGYFITPVPAKPEQLIAFQADFSMQTNIEGLQDFKYYRILDDNSPDQKILAMFQTEPSDPVDVATLMHSYAIRMDGADLQLHYRYCIEGCHLGFKRRLSVSSRE